MAPLKTLKLLLNTHMTYNSLLFFTLLMLFLAVYFLLKKQDCKKIWILLGSIVFYAWSGIAALIIVLGTAIIIYFASLKIESIYFEFEIATEGLAPKEQTAVLAGFKKKAKVWLWFAMFFILAIWIAVKAAKLFDMDTVTTLHSFAAGKGIIVPLGISYYSLSALGYLLDIFWRKTKPVHNFMDLFTVMIYFPHIIQGPISRYDKLLKQISNLPGFDYKRVCFGLQLMFWGYAKKLIIADRISIYTNAVFGSLDSYAGFEIFIAVLLNAIQLYADFSGCMDIVAGISETIGIQLEANFQQPFFAKSASEFWTRWHITLGAWTKAYIYLPIAMNPTFMKKVRELKKKHGKHASSFVNFFVPLLCVWLFTGLWHGTGWDYIAWGMYWCILMTISNETTALSTKAIHSLHIDTDRCYYKIWQCFATFMLFAVGRCFTAANSITGLFTILKRMFSQFNIWVLFDESLYQYGLDRKDFQLLIIGILVIFLTDFIHEKGISIRETAARQPIILRWIVYLTLILSIVIFGIYGPGYNAADFIYGAF